MIADRTEAAPLAVSRRTLLYALTAVLLIACGLRVWALDYGLPGVYNPDEVPILNRALTFAKGDPNPHNFLYPSLYFYMLFAWEGVFFLLGRAVGFYASLQAFQREYFFDPSHIILAGRALTVTCGVATVAAVYRFGARLYGRATGVGAALFLAVAPFAVRDAHYIKHDVPVTLFVTLALASTARLVVDPVAAGRVRSWLTAGALAGLAISTHYYAIFIVVPIIAAAVADLGRSGRWQASFRLLVWAGVASVFGFWAGSPFLPIEPHTAMRDMVAVREIDIDRAVVGHTAFVSLDSYLHMLATDAIGWPVATASAVGLVLAMATDWRRGLVLASFPLTFLGFLANTVPMNRYMNAMLPSLAVAAAFVVTSAAARTGRRAHLVATLLFAAAAVPGLAGSVQSDQFFRQSDTRALGLAFVHGQIPAGSSILTQPYSVPLRASREGLLEALRANLGSETRGSVKFQSQLALTPYPAPAYRTIYLGEAGGDPPPDILYVSPRAFEGDAGLGALRTLGITYVVLKRTNVDNPSLASFRDALGRGAHLLATFSPYRAGVDPARQAAVAPFLHNTAARIDAALERPGPTIEIWLVD